MKWIIIGVLGVLLLAGGGGTAAWFLMRSAPPAEEADGEAPDKPAEPPKAPVGGGIVPMEQFLVNLADRDASRFLRAKISLVVETKKEAEEIARDEVVQARLRSAVLELLTQQSAAVLNTPAGKAELKKAIVERTTTVFGAKKVLDVLFTDFVVQF